MSDDLFEDVKETKEEIVEEAVSEDVKEGLLAERDPASVMGDPFAVDKAEPVDVVGMSLERQISAMARSTGKKLNAMPKDNIVIPVDKMNKYDKFVEVGINGYNLRIMRGVKVALPRVVVDMLIAGGYGPTLVR